jgi:hypothetical protein
MPRKRKMNTSYIIGDIVERKEDNIYLLITGVCCHNRKLTVIDSRGLVNEGKDFQINYMDVSNHWS